MYRKTLPLINDDRTRQDVKGFMGQEAVHSRAHTEVLAHLAAQGIDTGPFTQRVDWLFERLLGDKPLGRELPAGLQRPWLVQRLAIISAIEHFTAVLGTWILDSPALDAADADPIMLDLLRWHGAEEVEHRSVAFDVYQHLAGGYARRVESMIVSAAAMAYLWISGIRYFMAHDPTRPGAAHWQDLFRSGRQGRLPTLGMIGASIPHYLRRSHHPSQEGSTEAALAYLATSPAATAAS